MNSFDLEKSDEWENLGEYEKSSVCENISLNVKIFVASLTSSIMTSSPGFTFPSHCPWSSWSKAFVVGLSSIIMLPVYMTSLSTFSIAILSGSMVLSPTQFVNLINIFCAKFFIPVES